MTRMVQCVKLGQELPGLAAPPASSDLGQRVYENVSQEAWNMWLQQATILINHYGLNLLDPQANAFIMEQMEDFFFGEDAQMPEGWTPPSQGGKGAPAPQSK
ncbi:MAG: oxidative damage protection protein [Chloroflexi bacterium]|nr:oxidative damage protection protein [Chloroflexota bacterium]